MNVLEELRDFKRDFDKRVLDFLDKKEKEAREIDSSYSELVKEIKRHVKAGGKRLRPAFVFYGYKAAGGKNFKEDWPACVAVELIHTFALIHDDIMDNSKLRRGKLTTWKLLGVNQAILVGDLAFTLAEELMSQLDLEKEKMKNAFRYFNLLKFEVIGGQYLDIKNNGAMGQWSNGTMEEIMKIMELKSARYTVARPLQIGAAIAGARRRLLNAFFEYGVNLGIAFQIQDDILGMFGDEKMLGKPVGSDLKEGKRTLLAAELMEKLSNCQIVKLSEKFNRIFGNKNLTRKDLQRTRQLMVKLQVLDFCQKKAIQLIKQAKKALREIKLDEESKDFLLGIADYMLERKY